MAPVRTPPGWPHLALLLSVLLLSACRSSAQSPPASEAHPRPLPLKPPFCGAWGPGPEGSLFSHPAGVTGDDAGFVYVADTGRNRVLKFNSAGPLVATWEMAGDGSRLSRPAGLATDDAGHVFVADTGNHRIIKFNTAGTPLATWGAPGGEDGQFNGPTAVVADAAGNLYVTDTKNHRVQNLSPAG